MSTPVPPAMTEPERIVAIRYRHDGEVVVRGRATGRLYHFTVGATLDVAAADARPLVAGGQFEVGAPRERTDAA